MKKFKDKIRRAATEKPLSTGEDPEGESGLRDNKGPKAVRKPKRMSISDFKVEKATIEPHVNQSGQRCATIELKLNLAYPD